MTIRELAIKCKDFKCEECQYQKTFEKFSEYIKNITPYGLLASPDEELE